MNLSNSVTLGGQGGKKAKTKYNFSLNEDVVCKFPKIQNNVGKMLYLTLSYVVKLAM